MSDALRLDNVVKNYGGFRALDQLSFTVPRGSICGPDRSQTVLAKRPVSVVIGGFLTAKYGTIDVLGHGSFSIAKHAGRIGMTPQDAVLDGHLKVGVQLAQLARLQLIGRDRVETEVARVLEHVGLSAQRDKRIAQLSHGMRRRVALAQAFIGSPELILLDEPTSGLDPELVAQVRELIGSLRGESNGACQLARAR